MSIEIEGFAAESKDPEATPADSQYQVVFVRARALKEAVKWCVTPGTKASDVVAVAVWFEDFLLHGENYQRPEDTEREDFPNGEGGTP